MFNHKLVLIEFMIEVELCYFKGFIVLMFKLVMVVELYMLLVVMLVIDFDISFKYCDGYVLGVWFVVCVNFGKIIFEMLV